jgi:nitrogen fixation/metabolism regulation signal transduction histidine kinase
MNRNTDSQSNSAIYENNKSQKLLFKVTQIETKKEIIRLVAVSDITKELDNREVDAWIKLARTLSHEIMNNITPITTLSHVIHNYFIENKMPVSVTSLSQKTINNTAKALEVIQERSAGLLNFVENYRKFTKLPEPNIKPCNLNDLLEKTLLTCSTFSYYQDTKIEMNLNISKECQTDCNLLSQVLINLIKNALEALAENNKENPILHLNANQFLNKTTIEIKNNGGEIPPQMREQIFVPFFTTKETGTGIGLSLSKQIMLKMGGDLILKTDKANYANFQLTI